MANFLVNGGAILAYLLIASYMLAYMRRVRARSIRNHLSRKQYVGLCLAIALLFLKFWNIGDGLLMAGQLLVLVMLGIFGLQRRQAARKARLAKRIDIYEEGQKLERTIEEAAGAIVAKKVKERDRKRLVVVALCVIVVICLVLGLIKLLNAPSQGIIKPQIATSTSKPTKLLPLKKNAFDTKYPDVFTPNLIDAAKPPFLEQYNFLKRQPLAWDLGVAIEALPSGNLRDDGSYNFRTVTANRFKERIENIAGNVVHIMTDTADQGGFAQAAFFTHDGKLAIVSLTGGTTNDTPAMQAAFTMVLSSWQWK